MNTHNIKTLIVLFTSIFSNIYSAISQEFVIPTEPFPIPTGQYNVGTKEYLWIDESRDENLTPDETDKVHILIQVWYPTEDESGVKQSYISKPDEFGNNTLYNNLQSVKTNAFVDASLSNQEKKYPVLVYSHGAKMSRFTNTFQAEHLASHGYIVFGIDHPSFNQTTLYPDGMSTKELKNFVEFSEEQDKYLNVINEHEVFDRGIVQYWAKDVSFVIDNIEKINKEELNFFYDKFDTEHLGMYAYSLGGILTLQMCAQDARIKAGVNSDGNILGYVWKTGINQPFLFIKPNKTMSTKEEVESHGQDYEAYLFGQQISKLREDFLLKNSYNEMYFLTIQDTKHNNFNDMALFETQEDNLIEVHLAHKIINDYTLSFFNKYLKSDDNSTMSTFPGKYKKASLDRKTKF